MLIVSNWTADSKLNLIILQNMMTVELESGFLVTFSFLVKHMKKDTKPEGCKTISTSQKKIKGALENPAGGEIQFLI